MKRYAATIVMLLLAATMKFSAQSSPDPFQGNGCWTGNQWVTNTHPLCAARASTPAVKTAVYPPTEDEIVPSYTYGDVHLELVVVRTADKSQWLMGGRTYRHPYNVEMKVGRTEFRCEDIGYGEICDLFQIGTVTIGVGVFEEGREIPFRLFAPMGPWVEVQ